MTATADTNVIDTNTTTVNTTVSNTSSEFNLSWYLILHHMSNTSSPRPSTSTSTQSPFRPWTPYPNISGLHTPTLSGDLDLDMAPNYMSTPCVPSRWDSPTEDMDLPPPSHPSPPPTDPTPASNPPPDLVTYNSTEPSPPHPVTQSDTVTVSTNTPAPTLAHPFLPTSLYMNYAPISERENSHIQQQIQALSNIAEELLPSRGSMVGEFVLFQYLLHRPRQAQTEYIDFISNVIVLHSFFNQRTSHLPTMSLICLLLFVRSIIL